MILTVNFNPILIKTQNGILFSNYEKIQSYYYDRNDVYIKLINDNIYMVYNLWLKNYKNYYTQKVYNKYDVDLSKLSKLKESVLKEK